MPNINVDMKSTADFAIKSARERFTQELDYSDQAIPMLENITTQIYWGFSSRDKNAREDGLVYNTAVIWGSYLGEYMRRKWGGTWVLKGSDPVISINDLEFSPINLVYQIITTHPEYCLENFISEASKKITPVAIAPQPSQSPIKNIKQPTNVVSNEKSTQPRTLDRRLIIALAGIGGLFLVTLVCVIGYTMVNAGGLSAFGLFGSDPGSNTVVLIEKNTLTPTTFFTNTPDFPPTLLPTYTPKPSSTLLPTQTPSATYTQMASLTPTETLPSYTPTRTPAPTRPTRTPTNTPFPATEVPPPTKTNPPPPPTVIEPPPVVIDSCSIDPSTVPAGFNVTLTFSAHFSAPGYGFDALMEGGYPGQTGCSGTDTNGDGTATCNGNSGLLPGSTKVNVTFRSSVGDCTASYSAP